MLRCIGLIFAAFTTMQSKHRSVCVHKFFGCVHHAVLSVFSMAFVLGTACMAFCIPKQATAIQPCDMLVFQVMTIYSVNYP